MSLKDALNAIPPKHPPINLPPEPKPPPAPRVVKPFSEHHARRMLSRIALGETLTQICKSGQYGLLTVYEWLRSDATIDKIPFSLLYERAQEDRAKTWQDEAAIAYKDVEISGDRADMARIKLAGDHARMLVGLVKENRMDRKTKTVQAQGQMPTVIIETFATDAAQTLEIEARATGSPVLPSRAPD